MTRTFVLYVTVAAMLAVGLLSVLSIEQVSAQMMNPNTMMNRNMMPNGSLMKPNMMFNGSWMNPMFMQGLNITGSIKLMPTMFNSVASQIKVSLSNASGIKRKSK